MPALSSYDYAAIRLVPRVEREEFINVGVILFCRTRRFLGALIDLEAERIASLAPELDQEEVLRYLAAIPLICAGGEDAGPIGCLSQSERFHWLVAPRSTIIQVSLIHTGLTADPSRTLEHLLEMVVRRPVQSG